MPSPCPSLYLDVGRLNASNVLSTAVRRDWREDDALFELWVEKNDVRDWRNGIVNHRMTGRAERRGKGGAAMIISSHEALRAEQSESSRKDDIPGESQSTAMQCMMRTTGQRTQVWSRPTTLSGVSLRF